MTPGPLSPRASTLAAALALALVFALALAAAGRGSVTSDVSPRVAAELMRWPETVVLDVRTPEEYAEEHIAGATLLPLQKIQDEFQTDEVAPSLSTPIVVYCAAGARSARACEALAACGFTRLHNLQGGLRNWKAEGFPVVKPSSADVTARAGGREREELP